MLAEEQKQETGRQSRNQGDGHFRCQCFLFPYFHVSYPFFSRARLPHFEARVCDSYEHTTRRRNWQVAFPLNMNEF